MNFDDATSVRSAAPGRYDAMFPPEFSLADTRPNGGYVVACLGRAALHAAREAGASHEHVLAVSAQFISSPPLGPATITTSVLRVGKTATHVQASTDGVLAFFTLGSLTPASEPFWGTVAPVELPPIEVCAPSPIAADRGLTLLFDPATSFTMTPDGPVVTGGGEFRCWLIDHHRDAIDTVGQIYAADCIPPATFSVVMTGWVPTLNMSVYMRALPAPGPLRIRFRAQVIQDGFADEICEAWDMDGRLVLQSTQIVALRLT